MNKKYRFGLPISSIVRTRRLKFYVSSIVNGHKFVENRVRGFGQGSATNGRIN